MMRIGICLTAGVLPLALFVLWQGSGPAAASSEACRSLAAIYARAPEQMGAQAKAALQNCLAIEAEEQAGAVRPSGPSSQDTPGASAPQSEDTPQGGRQWGEWPDNPAWTEHWPSPNPW
jgi:hypothetical protein